MKFLNVKGFFLFALGVALLGLGGAAVLLAVRSGSQGPSFSHTGPTITELENLGHLTVVRVHVADVIEGEQSLWYGTVKGAWIIRGDALLAVDMRRARILAKDESSRTATISLPPPSVLEARVDHDVTRTYRVDRGFFVSTQDESNLRDHAMRQAQMFVEQSAGSEDSMAKARETAEKLLRQFYALVGWTVTVEWQDQSPSTHLADK